MHETIPCRWCGRPARSGPIGLGDIEDDLCLVCRGLAGLADARLVPAGEEPPDLARLHDTALIAAHAELGLHFALGPREEAFGCWWCGRPGRMIATAVEWPYDPTGRLLFGAPVLCETCRDLIGYGVEATPDPAVARDRLLRELGHEPDVVT